MSAAFPLVTLQPVADSRHVWVALLLETTPSCNGAALTRLFVDFELDEALGPLPCIVTLPDLSAAVEALPPQRSILRLPAAFCCDRANDAPLQALRAQGFRFMATGVPLPGKQLCDGVDALALPCPGREMPIGMDQWLSRLPGPHLALDGARPSCPARCHFQWLARHFGTSAKPMALSRGSDAPNRVLLLELLSQVANDADSHAIEGTIKRDPQLSYHLLKLVNSVAFALTAKIASFSQAITLLGRRQLQRWLQLLLYARAQNTDTANPLLPRAALRAGLVEALCASRGGSHDAQDRAFMAGMFSLLDVLFGMPIADVVKPLNLADDVLVALTERSGPLGPLLRAAEAGEDAANGDLAAVLAEAGLSREDWARSLIRASAWAIQISREA